MLSLCADQSFCGGETVKRFLAVLAVLLIAAVPLCAQTMYKATLTWTDNSDNEDGFKVERNDGTQSGPFSEIASLPANSLSYVDQPLAPGEGHCWRILAFNSV